MNQLTTTGIILARTDFGEADRIITLLTPDHGKLRLMAKGVRRVKSKLAGGIELFSVSHITFIKGRGDIGTLISSRLITHYGAIVTDIERVQLGYELLKTLNKITEDETEAEYFSILQTALAALDDVSVNLKLIETWFLAQLLKQGGLAPNLVTDITGAKLAADKTYNFSFDDHAFFERTAGTFQADNIKFLRLLFSDSQPKTLEKVRGSADLLSAASGVVQTMARSDLHV